MFTPFGSYLPISNPNLSPRMDQLNSTRTVIMVDSVTKDGGGSLNV